MVTFLIPLLFMLDQSLEIMLLFAQLGSDLINRNIFVCSWDSLDLAFIPIHQDLDIERVFPSHWSAETMSSGLGLGVRWRTPFLGGTHHFRNRLAVQLKPPSDDQQTPNLAKLVLINHWNMMDYFFRNPSGDAACGASTSRVFPAANNSFPDQHRTICYSNSLRELVDEPVREATTAPERGGEESTEGI